MSGIGKYLARYAEPEAALAANVSREYGASLVVPALAESPDFLDGYRDAARSARAPLLVIVVVNARADAASDLREQNASLLAALTAWNSTELDVLAVDRSSPGRELPPKQGVGLARKIGLDLALALVARGNVRSPWLFGTDADATLPVDFFERAPAGASSASALLYPFVHAGGDAAVEAATLRYEASLRYHVLGLAFAGSPYAYHSVGSAMVVAAEAYASVRGVPKREAGEDFYLLEKLAKLAPVLRLAGEPIALRARRSSRAPFGTGPAVSEILDQGEVSVAHPEAFAALGRLIAALDELARDRQLARFESSVTGILPEPGAFLGFLERLGLFDACAEAIAEVGAGDLRRRLHTWFDGRRTLRTLHALRDAAFPELGLARALECAAFTRGAPGLDESATLVHLRELERRLPRRVGPTALTK